MCRYGGALFYAKNPDTQVRRTANRLVFDFNRFDCMKAVKIDRMPNKLSLRVLLVNTRVPKETSKLVNSVAKSFYRCIPSCDLQVAGVRVLHDALPVRVVRDILILSFTCLVCRP
jgi:hypothetical protein